MRSLPAEIPPEIQAQEKEIEAIFRDMVTRPCNSADQSETEHGQEIVALILIAVLLFLIGFGLYILQIKVNADARFLGLSMH